MMSDARKSLDEMNGKGVMIGHSRILKGITGIIATKLYKAFQVPALVLSCQTDTVSGSIRCGGELDIPAFFQAHEAFLLDFGGHECAAGFSLPAGKLDGFTAAARAWVRDLKLVKKEEILNIDAELPAEYLTQDIRDVVERLGPYGIGFPPITFLTRGVTVEDIEQIGRSENGHIKLLIGGTPLKWPCVFWNGMEKYKNGVFEKNDTVDIVYKIRKNYYQNNEILQLSLTDIRGVSGKERSAT
jgi:single-stranded-DNA-specific exonuclease